MTVAWEAERHRNHDDKSANWGGGRTHEKIP